MEHIEQLKKIRLDAIQRLRSSDDYRLAQKLGLLIVDLGEKLDDKLAFDPATTTSRFTASSPKPLSAAATVVETPRKEASHDKSQKAEDASGDAMIDELVAEIQNDSSLTSLTEAGDKKGKVGPFSKPFEAVAANGSAAG